MVRTAHLLHFNAVTYDAEGYGLGCDFCGMVNDIDRCRFQVAPRSGARRCASCALQRRGAPSCDRTRRTVLTILPSLVALSPAQSWAGLDKYVKKRRLDSLASYIPAILVAQGQLLDVPAAAEQFGLEAARALLREGAFVGLRDNVRAVGEYASDVLGKDASKARVTAFFKAIERLDTTIFMENRKPNPIVPDNLQLLVDDANGALQRVLEIVPEEDLDKGREMVEVIRSAASALQQQAEEGNVDVNVDVEKQLRGLL